VKRNRFKPFTKARKAVLYARYSPRPGEDCRTITSQFIHGREYCVAQHWDIDSEWADEGITGTSTEDRLELAKAIKRVKEIRGVLVCYSMSRLARNVTDILNITDDLEENGCDLFLGDISVETTTPAGKMYFTIMAAIAQLQADQIGTTTSDCMRSYQKIGWMMGSVAPYGWKPGPDVQEVANKQGVIKRRRIMVMDEHEQDALDIMLRCHVLAWSYKKIVEHLELCGYRNRNGKKFDCKTVWKIIERERIHGNPARVTANAKFVREHIGLLKSDGSVAVEEDDESTSQTTPRP
jgi:site-specific DNA recombinase